MMVETTDAVSEQPRDTASATATPREVVETLLSRLLGRRPGEREVELWSSRLSRSTSATGFLSILLQWRKLQETTNIPLQAAPGHPNSPIVDPAAVRGYVAESRRASADGGTAGILFPLEPMEAFWERNRDVIAATPFPHQPTAPFRYALGTGAYGAGDAAILRAMVQERRPQRIVSVGSGASTAALLDTLDELGLDVRPMVLEPFPKRLKAVLRPDDEARIELVKTPVQTAPFAPFAALQADDILLVDSSHVLKTGSDVHHILFYILPILNPGVLVHFSNCRFPLEYADNQIFEKELSLNEIYAVRAMLMYSSRFRVMFSGSYFCAMREDVVGKTFAPFVRNSGGALWLEVVDDGGRFGLDAVGGLTGFKAEPATAPKRAAGGAKVVLQPGSEAKGGGRRKVPAEMTVGAATLTFNILEGGTGPVYFSLGVRKSGSTMLHKIINLLARTNKVNIVDIPGSFFKNGLTAADWAPLDLEPLMKPGNIFSGFRNFPVRMGQTATYRDGLKVFMHRDPRDAIVSQYFSDAFSHELPKATAGDGRQRFLEKRGEAKESDIDGWVIRHAPSLARTLKMFAPTLSDPSCLILPYETYVFEKRTLIEKALDHFGWTAEATVVDEILAEVDVKPKAEDPKRFVRKATPGDHKEKLKPETTEELGRIFAEPMKLFGYS